MKLILAFLIFGSVIAAGSALKCDTCKAIGPGVNNCPGVRQECENQDDVCGTQIENNILRGDNIQTVKKGCITKKQLIVCTQPMVLNSTKDFEFLLYSKCCSSDGCNSGSIQMPPVSKLPNGHSCQSCFVENSLKCTEFETVPCTGNQFQCLNFTGIAARPGQSQMPYAFQGCVTLGACHVDLQALPGSWVDPSAEYKCTPLM